MDLPGPIKPLKINRWLPYWAVFQMDVRQTLRSWVFRLWIAAGILLSFGYLLHRAAIHHQAGLLQSAASLSTELLQFSIVVGTSLVVVLTAGCISSERGTVADSVLSRGISRYQYFIGKWHARLCTVLGSFVGITVATMLTGCFLLEMDMSIRGSLLALALVAAFLAVVVSAAVSASAICDSTVLGIAVLWMVLYGVGVALAILGYGQLNPVRLLRLVPALVHGEYDLHALARLFGWLALASLASAVVGLIYFARRDV